LSAPSLEENLHRPPSPTTPTRSWRPAGRVPLLYLARPGLGGAPRGTVQMGRQWKLPVDQAWCRTTRRLALPRAVSGANPSARRIFHRGGHDPAFSGHAGWRRNNGFSCRSVPRRGAVGQGFLRAPAPLKDLPSPTPARLRAVWLGDEYIFTPEALDEPGPDGRRIGCSPVVRDPANVPRQDHRGLTLLADPALSLQSITVAAARENDGRPPTSAEVFPSTTSSARLTQRRGPTRTTAGRIARDKPRPRGRSTSASSIVVRYRTPWSPQLIDLAREQGNGQRTDNPSSRLA